MRRSLLATPPTPKGIPNMSNFERSSRYETSVCATWRQFGSTQIGPVQPAQPTLPDLQDAEQADAGRRVARLSVQRLCEP